MSDRLSQLRDYAVGLALMPYLYRRGCQRDLDDIIAALDELKELRERVAMLEMEAESAQQKVA